MSDVSTIRSAMTEALHAGIAPIPIGANKRPAVRWADYIERLPDLAELHSWPATSGYGIVCGGPSRLLVLDIEARFMDRLGDLSVALEGAGMLRTFETWLEGYSVATPGGGMHVAIHLGGDDPVPGNEKLAMLDGLVAVETRGQGGYVVGPGSNGDTHPSGGTWTQIGGGFETIAWTTVAEWELVRRILVGFDVAPVLPSPPAVRAPAPRTASWIDAALDAYPSIESVLQNHGWVPARSSDQYGQHWVRPGKQPREGHSASLSANSRLYVHSTNAGLPVGNPTLDALDIELAYRLGRRPTPDERVAELRRWSPATATVQASARSTTGEVGSPPAMDLSVHLPDEFWQATPYLAAIRDVSLNQFPVGVSPDLVWQAVRTMYSATLPWNLRLPGNGTLDVIGLMVGASGVGKTTAKNLALELLPEGCFEIEGVALGLPPGTGEGIIERFVERDSKGRQTGLALRGGGFYVDEGGWLFDTAARQGSTTMQILKQAWSGEMTGSLAATTDRRRVVPPRGVRASFLIGAQPGVASRFLAADLSDGGLPQRVSWAWGHHPEITEGFRTERPDRLDVPVYDYHKWGGGSEPSVVHTLDFDPEILAGIRQRAKARRQDETAAPALEGHADLMTMKGAALHALLRGSSLVENSDWMLSAMEMDASRATRGHVQQQFAQSASSAATAAGRYQAHKDAAALAIHIDQAVASLVRKVEASSTALTVRVLKDHLRSYRRRYGLDYREIIDVAAERKKVVVHSDESVSVWGS